MKLNKYIKAQPIVVEKGEYVQDLNGKISKVSPFMPTHDDTDLVKSGKVKKVKKGKGGIFLNNIGKIVSATQNNRNQKDKTYTEVDESIKFDKDEAKKFIQEKFGLNAKINSSMSPAKVIDKSLEAKDKFAIKFKNLNHRKGDKFSDNSLLANKAQLAALPSLEEIFNTVFEEQEQKKSLIQPEDTYAQVGSDNTTYRPQLKSKFLLQQQQDLEKAKNVMDPEAEKAFRQKYEMSSHAFKMKTDPKYNKQVLEKAKLNPSKVDYPANNTKRADYVAPNNRFMFPNLSGKAQANMTNQTNEFIAGELAGALPLTPSVKRINDITSAPKLVDDLKKVSSDFKNFYDNMIVEPLAAKVNKKNGIDGKEASDFLHNWYNDSETKSRLYNLSNDDLAVEFYKHPPEKIKFKSFYNTNGEKNLLGVSEGDFDNLYMNNKALYKNKIEFNSTGVHEGTHALTSNGKMFTNTENDMLLKPFGTDYNNYLSNIKYDKEFAPKKYFLDPTEIHARINEARFHLNKKPTDLVTEDEVTSLIEKNNFFGMGDLIKDKAKMADLMNKFYGVSGAGVVASQVDKKQTGGTVYVESKNDPRYKAYQDSLSLYNGNINSRKLNKNFDYIKQGKFIPYNNLKKELIKHYGKTDPNLFQQPSGLIQHGKFNYFKNKVSESGYWENQDSYSKFIKKNLKNKPVGFLEEVEENYSEHPNYNAVYKKPTQPVKVLQRHKLPNLQELDSQPFQEYKSRFHPLEIESEMNYTPGAYEGYERVSNSEYSKNSDGQYSEFKHKYAPGKFEFKSRIKQQGGKTKLANYPKMNGSRPVLGTSSGKSIEVLDNRTISMDQIYDSDSVTVKGNKGTTFYKSKLQKYVKR